MNSLSDYTPYSLVLVDSMNMAGRMDWIDLSFNSHRTGMLYGFAKFVIETKTKWPGTRIVFLWEGANQWRRRKYPFYKSKRKSNGDPAAFFSRVDVVRSFLRHLPVEQASIEGFEADDLAGFLVGQEHGKTLLVSKDKDWWQFVLRSDVEVMYGNQIKSMEDVSKELGYPPASMGLYKALKGDPSDNIPGVDKFPSSLAISIANVVSPDSYGLFDRVVHYCRSNGDDNWANKLLKSRDVFETNRELTICDPFDIDPDHIDWVSGRPDESAAVNVLLRHGMENMAERYQEEWNLVGRQQKQRE